MAHFLGRKPYKHGHHEDGLCAQQIKTLLFPPNSHSTHLTRLDPPPILRGTAFASASRKLPLTSSTAQSSWKVVGRTFLHVQMGIQGHWELSGNLDPKIQEALDVHTPATPGAQPWVQGLNSRQKIRENLPREQGLMQAIGPRSGPV